MPQFEIRFLYGPRFLGFERFDSIKSIMSKVDPQILQTRLENVLKIVLLTRVFHRHEELV